MSQGPNMRKLMNLMESYSNYDIEADKDPVCQECGDRYDSELADSKHPELCISCDDKKSGTSFDFGFEDDIAIEDAVPADRFVGDDFGPPTNMCPDCEGTGEGRSGFDPNFPGLGYDCKRCNGKGQISEDSDMPGFGYDEEEDEEEDQHYDMKNAEKEKFKGKVIIVTDLYDGDVYGILNKKRFMISSPLWRGLEGPGEVTDDEVEIHSPDSNLSSREKNFLRRWHLSIINEELGIKEGGRAYEEFYTVKLNGKAIGSVWQDGPRDWQAEVSSTGMSWGSISTRKQAEDLVRREYLNEGERKVRPVTGKKKGFSSVTAKNKKEAMEKAVKKYGDNVTSVKLNTGKPNLYMVSMTEDKGDKPYATMKDGPDKYLFRKDGKQKLVGSANNEPENGEEELEETDMDEFIREMQIAAGIIVAETTTEKLNEETGGPFDNKKDAQSNAKSEIGGGKEGINFKTYKKDDGWHWTEKVDEEEVVDEGKLPDALKKHQFGAKDDDDSVDDKNDDKEEVDEEIMHWMKRFDRLSPTLNEDCPTDPEKNDDGDCSPFTHADDNVDMVRENDFIEDLLLAPKDKTGPEVDEEGRKKDPFAGVDTSFSHEELVDETNDRYDDDLKCVHCGDYYCDSKFGGKCDKIQTDWVDDEELVDVDDFSGPELDHLRHPDDIVHDSGPELDHLRHPDDIEEGPDDKYGEQGYVGDGRDPGQYDRSKSKRKQGGPREQYRIIDVGDDEDYETYDFNDEFEAMLGGSSDPVDGRRAGSMYEMNDLRRLAGLEQVIEDEKYEAGDSDWQTKYGVGYIYDEDTGEIFAKYKSATGAQQALNYAQKRQLFKTRDGKIIKGGAVYSLTYGTRFHYENIYGTTSVNEEAAFNENSQESPIKALRQILQAEGIKTGRGYNDKNVGNRKIRVYTDRGLVKRAGNRKGPTPGRSIKDIEALVTAGMEKAGYQVRKVQVFPGMNKNNPNYFVGGGFDARMYPNVAVWLEGDPVGSRYQKKLDEFAPIIGAIAGGVARGAAGVARGVAGATKSVVGGIAGVAAEMGGDDDVEEGFPNSDFPDADVIAYEIDDERAYYVMADALGANLDFGPEDEILVPAQYNDQVVLELEKAGFEQGKDFWVAGEQYEADLQNGYDDRKFSDGQDYFPKGAQSQPSSDLGPSASSMADNPMSNKMRMVKKDDVYETMKLEYRRFRKA